MKAKTLLSFLPSPHPLVTGSFRNWIKLLRKNGGVSRKYALKALRISLMNLVIAPHRMYGRMRWGKEIENVQIQYAPIFILGHWRSGTTFLHNVMCQDHNLGYISTFQAFAPELCLGNGRIFKFFFKLFLPKQRPMDNIPMTPHAPQEEEFALGNLSPYSFYHGWYFPRSMAAYFRQFVLYEKTSEEMKNEWKTAYLKVLKQATYMANGKRLVLKNPLNTARIRILLEMFPDARFIHVYRNPYIIYASTRYLLKKVLQEYALQHVSEREIEKNTFYFYQKMMQHFWQTNRLIPQKNFVEVRFEDFENNALHMMEKIYNALALPGFEHAQERFRRYTAAQANYKKNTYTLDDETIEKISLHWKFAIGKLQYTIPEEVLTNDSRFHRYPSKK